jgi:hypothetical protein
MKLGTEKSVYILYLSIYTPVDVIYYVQNLYEQLTILNCQLEL